MKDALGHGSNPRGGSTAAKGDAPARPVVVPHAGTRSVGTHSPGGIAHAAGGGFGALLQVMIGLPLGIGSAIVQRVARNMRRAGGGGR